MFRQSFRQVLTSGAVTSALLLSVALAAPAQAAPLHDTALSTVADTSVRLASLLDAKSGALNGEVERFYQRRDFAPVWVSNGGLNSRGRAALEVLKMMGEDGGQRDLYLTSLLQSPLSSDMETLTEAEYGLTRGVLSFIRDRKFGRFNPRSDYGQSRSEAAGSEAQALRELVIDGNLSQRLQEVGPNNPRYDRLVQRLEEYRAIVGAGGWPRLPSGGLLTPGAKDNRIPVLRRILAITGDLPVDAARELGFDSRPQQLTAISLEALHSGLGDTNYDDALAEAVKRFQQRHGLEVDGLIGGQTRDVINVSADDRFNQIIINLERMRWHRNFYSQRHVEVNIPEFRLRGYRDGVMAMDMPVIVGRDARQTPTMNDFITNVKFNPDWNVPKTIVEQDIIPKLISNPLHANEIGLQTLRGGRLANPLAIDWANTSASSVRFRQPPGPKNPLGQMRFSMTNNQAIFLHDTPNRGMFTRDRRDGSSGCVRVGDPKGLAQFLLTKPEIDGPWIDQVVRTIQTKFVPLDAAVPVSLTYYTAFVGDDGQLHFRTDIYGKDLELIAQMS